MDGEEPRRHELVRDGDVVRLVFHGPLTLVDAQALRACVDEVLSAGPCYLLVDMRGMTVMEPAARQAISDWGRSAHRQVSGAALFGASFAMRVLTTLILSAIRVLGRRDIVAHFARDEAEARAWLVARRAAVSAQEQAR